MLTKENIQEKLEQMAVATDYLAQFEHFRSENLVGATDGLKAIRKVVYICLEDIYFVCNHIVSNIAHGKATDQRSMLQQMITMEIIPVELGNALLKILPARIELMHQVRIDPEKLLPLAQALPNILDGFIHFISLFIRNFR